MFLNFFPDSPVLAFSAPFEALSNAGNSRSPKLHPAEAKARERQLKRESASAHAGDKAVRDNLTATLRAAAEKRWRKVLGAVAARNEPAPFEMRAWETVCKWDDTAEKLKRAALLALQDRRVVLRL